MSKCKWIVELESIILHSVVYTHRMRRLAAACAPVKVQRFFSGFGARAWLASMPPSGTGASRRLASRSDCLAAASCARSASCCTCVRFQVQNVKCLPELSSYSRMTILSDLKYHTYILRIVRAYVHVQYNCNYLQ